MGYNDGHTREERKQRYAALPDILVQMLEHIKAQQEEYFGIRRPCRIRLCGHENEEDDIFVQKVGNEG